YFEGRGENHPAGTISAKNTGKVPCRVVIVELVPRSNSRLTLQPNLYDKQRGPANLKVERPVRSKPTGSGRQEPTGSRLAKLTSRAERGNQEVTALLLTERLLAGAHHSIILCNNKRLRYCAGASKDS